jgi:hypothetical protein
MMMMRLAVVWVLLTVATGCGGAAFTAEESAPTPATCTGSYPTTDYACETNPTGPGSDIVLTVDGVEAFRCTCLPGCTANPAPDGGAGSVFGCAP